MIIGNYLALGADNPHKDIFRNMLELYVEWFLIYRTKEEIMDFTSDMNPEMIESVEIRDEYFGQSISAPGAIGFLIVRKASA